MFKKYLKFFCYRFRGISIKYNKEEIKMAFIMKQGGRADYNYKEYILDSANELNSINKETACPGSIAYIVTTGDVYMLSNNKQWEEQ